MSMVAADAAFFGSLRLCLHMFFVCFYGCHFSPLVQVVHVVHSGSSSFSLSMYCSLYDIFHNVALIVSYGTPSITSSFFMNDG